MLLCVPAASAAATVSTASSDVIPPPPPPVGTVTVTGQMLATVSTNTGVIIPPLVGDAVFGNVAPCVSFAPVLKKASRLTLVVGARVGLDLYGLYCPADRVQRWKRTISPAATVIGVLNVPVYSPASTIVVTVGVLRDEDASVRPCLDDVVGRQEPLGEASELRFLDGAQPRRTGPAPHRRRNRPSCRGWSARTIPPCPPWGRRGCRRPCRRSSCPMRLFPPWVGRPRR